MKIEPKILPLVRKIYPGMIAQQITGVQPMTDLSGIIFDLKVKYSWRYRLKRWWISFKWKCMPGTVIALPSPLSVPADLYREWLETNVGKKGWDWEWYFNPKGTIDIKFRLGKGKWATVMALRWS